MYNIIRSPFKEKKEKYLSSYLYNTNINKKCLINDYSYNIYR